MSAKFHKSGNSDMAVLGLSEGLFSLEIMEAFGRQNKPVFTVFTTVLTDFTVLAALFFQIWGSISRGG